MAWLDQLSALGDSVLRVVFPECCDFCNGPLDYNASIPLCRGCLSTIQRIPEPVCDRCGFSIPREWQSDTCPTCVLDPPPFHRAGFAVIYEGQVRQALSRFKYSGNLHLRRSLSELLFEGFQARYPAADFDLVVPVPVHWRKLRSRGFNQALLLASDLARRIRVPVSPRVLVKTRETRAQVGLSRAERITNLAGSFGVSHPRNVADRQILLVDDVSTTGTTIREAASVLKSAGARTTDVMVLAARFWEGMTHALTVKQDFGNTPS